MDIVNSTTRSRMMSAVRSENTLVEMEIRRRLFALGFRYRLHDRRLPGRPDLVFPQYTAVILVHGCFWHHHGCHLSEIPQTRRDWWKRKLLGNRRRDRRVVSELHDRGWRTLTIWECSFRRRGTRRQSALDRIAVRAAAFLRSRRSTLEIPASEIVIRGRTGG